MSRSLQQAFIPSVCMVLILVCCPGLAGCSDTDSKGRKKDDTSGDVTVLGPDQVLFNDTEAGIDITIQGGNSPSWTFGVIMDGHHYEESCRNGEGVCHTLGPTGGTLGHASSCSQVSDGSTCIPRLYWRQGVLTFMLQDELGLLCWTWGDYPSYYESSMGCTQTSWSDDSY